MREFALTEMERAGAFEDAERTFQMTEDAFRVFYEPVSYTHLTLPTIYSV